MANPVKNYKTYNYLSRYESFPYFYDEDSNKYYYGLTSFLDTSNTSYTIYEVKPGDSYDSIALDNYGSALFYWIITDYNRIFDEEEVTYFKTQVRRILYIEICFTVFLFIFQQVHWGTICMISSIMVSILLFLNFFRTKFIL